MIQFLQLELTNFAIYPKASFSFSTDPERPLTVIRGENESGKTTLMRAFLWVLFGADGIQEATGSAYALRPVWLPKGDPVETKVKLTFRQTKGDRTVTFNLVRRLVTTDGVTALNLERVLLSRQDSDGSFKPLSEAQIETLHGIIRPEMRDFYFLDADKAVDFVGGTETNHNDQVMRKMIGKSIRALLSLDDLRKAADRVDELRNVKLREIAKSNTGATGINLQGALTQVESVINKLKDEIPVAKEAHDVAAEVYRRADEQFTAMIETFEKASKRAGELKKFRDDRERLNIQRRQLMHQLAERGPGAELAAAMLTKSLKEIIDRLEPMKEKGHIPPSELEVIPRLVKRGRCLCGTAIAEGTPEAEELSRLLDKARKTETGSRFLDGVLSLATTHKRVGAAAVRSEPIMAIKTELARLDPLVGELSRAIEGIEKEVTAEGGQQSVATEVKRDVNEKLAVRDSRRDALQRLQTELEGHETSRRSLQEKIRAAAGHGAQVKALKATARAAELVCAVLREAYVHVERDQVAEVSACMSGLFGEMIGTTADGLISEVGLRAIGQQVDNPEYEIFARYQNADKPLRLINGASRRALAVSFFLALAEQTGIRVPLVSDSLLHSTSGEVRRRLVELLSTGQRAGQPIMFGTRADFQAPEIRSVLKRCAGVNYTLTAQSHVGRDVVRADPDRQQSNQVSVCRCAPEEFCAVCERVDDASAANLRRRVT